MVETTVEITLPDGQKVCPERDLDFGQIADIATRHECGWLALVQVPFAVPALALSELYDACCAARGVPRPDLLSTKAIFDAVNAVPVDLPQDYQDGDPKAEARPTT